MNKRLISILLATVFLLSSFGAVLAEDTVTVTQNGVDLNGATNVPLALTPTVTFPTAVTSGTALGITLSDGTTQTSPAVTEGAVTEGAFTTATVSLRALAAGKTYTLTVPAAGENAERVITFTTVPAPYYINEELNGSTLADWYGINSDKRVLSDSSSFIDTDSDSILDAKKTSKSDNGRWYGPRLWDVSTSDATQLTFEARFKPAAGSTGVFSGYANANGSLFSVGTDMSGNGRRPIRTQGFGNSGFGVGGTQSSSSWSGETKYSEFPIYKNTWYTIRVTMNSTEKKYSAFIYDDAGNALETASVGTNYNAAVSTIETIHFTYVDARGAEHIDYIKAWDNGSELLGDVTVTDSDGNELDGTTDVPKDGSVTATVNFTNAITQADLDKITVSGQATTQKTLSDDGKAVSLSVSGFEYNKKYYINIPQIGTNKAAVSSFSTEGAPVNIYYQKNGETLNLKDATDVPLNFSATYLMEEALDANTDLSGITMSSGGQVSAVLAEDGKSITLNISNLEYLSKYTLHIPSFGVNAELNVNIETEKGKYLFRADFDSNDLSNYSFVRADYSTASTITSGVNTSTGLLTYTHGTEYYANIKFDNILNTENKNIAYESKVKFTKGKDTGRPEGIVSTSKTFYGIRGENHNYSMKIAGIKGFLATGAKDNVSSDNYVVSDYNLKTDTNYKIRFEYTSGNKNFKVLIKDLDDPAAKTFVMKGSADSSFKKIYGLYLPYTWQYGAVVDYMHIIDRDIEAVAVDEPEFSTHKIIEGEELSASAKYVDTELEEAVLVLALYDKDSKVTRIATTDLDLTGSGAVKTATVKMTPAEGETMAKAFVWNSMDKMMPYSTINACVSDDMRETNIYVSAANGSDTEGDGSADAPFATVGYAIDKIKALNSDSLYKNADMTLVVEEGEYNIASSITIDDEEISNMHSLTIKGVGDAGLVGGVSVRGRDFNLVTDEAQLAMLNPDVHGKVYALNLSDCGVNLDFSSASKSPDPMRSVLYYNGVSKTMARYPNYSNLYTDNVLITKSAYQNGTALRGTEITDAGISSAKKEAWSTLDLSEAWSKGWYFYDWEQLFGRFTAVTDTGITVNLRTNRAVGTTAQATKYFIYNLPYEIDTAGEYAILDNVLYFYPLAADVTNGNFADARIQLNINTGSMFKVTADNITFENLSFENQGSYFVNAAGDNIKILGCEFFNSADNAVAVNGYNNLISSCDFHDIGGLAVSMKGGNINTLTPSGSVLENCYFTKTGQVSRTGVSAFRLQGCGVTARKNTVTNTPHTAVGYSGNNHIIEYNDFYNCLTDGSSDAGIIYSGRNLANIGTIIQYNYIHDSNSGHGSIYWDDRLSGQRANGNVFENIYWVLFIHAGICNTFNDNIIVKGPRSSSGSTTVSFRGRTYNVEDGGSEYKDSDGNKYNMWFTEPFFANKYSHTLNTFLAHLVGSDSAALGSGYTGVPWEGDIWQNAYGVGSADDENINTDENYKHVLNYVNYKATRKIEETVMKNNFFAGFSKVGIGNNVAETSADYINPETEIVNENNTYGELTGDRLTQYNNVVNNCGIYVNEYRTSLD